MKATRPVAAAWFVVLVSLLGLTGCKSASQERVERDQARAAAEQNVRMYQRHLDSNPIGSRFGNDPELLKMQEYRDNEANRAWQLR